MNRLRQRKRAVTLVEVLIALILAVMMVIGIITLLSFNFVYQNQQELRASAMDAMAREMEKLKRQFIFTVDPYVIEVSDNRTPNNPHDDTTGTLTVKLYDRDGAELTTSSPGYDRVRVAMTVTWHGRGRLASREFHEELVSFLIP